MDTNKRWYGYMVQLPNGLYQYIEHRVDAVKFALSVGQVVFYNCLTCESEKC
jgi:hypothetical protein